jgi:hypothetical protein
MKCAQAMAIAMVAGFATAASAAAPTFCSGPQNADAFPSNPVLVKTDQCHHYQQYESTSPTTNYNSGCSGYTVAFGSKGGLKHPVDGHTLWVDWGDTPPTAASCASSHVEGIAWGYRCGDRGCRTGDWEQIGAAKSDAGNWNSNSKVCYVGVNFISKPDSDYLTVSVDARAYRQQGETRTPKKVKVKIYAYRHTGKCVSATPSGPSISPSSPMPPMAPK